MYFKKGMRLKMKILRKINKGLILTIIVLLALTVYLVNIEKQRKWGMP